MKNRARERLEQEGRVTCVLGPPKKGGKKLPMGLGVEVSAKKKKKGEGAVRTGATVKRAAWEGKGEDYRC
jgi:hypothetical protein